MKHSDIWKVWLVIAAAFIPFCGTANIWYVDPTATGNQNGDSWGNAFNNLKPALAKAVAGDMVWVAKGTYVPDTGNKRDECFKLKPGVSLYGGFNGTETSLAQRETDANETILSGNIGDKADSTDNSYTILLMDHPDSTTIVDGLTFSHGFAVSDTSFNLVGPTLSGAAVFIEASNGVALPLFVRCRFVHNFAKGSGGAVFTRANQSKQCLPRFKYCYFYDNRALKNGGAIYIRGGVLNDQSIEVDSCTFVKCMTERWGGAIFFRKDIGSVHFQIKNASFVGNEAFSYGCCLSMETGSNGPLDLEVAGTVFFENSRHAETLIYCEDVFPTENSLRDCLITDSRFISNGKKGGITGNSGLIEFVPSDGSYNQVDIAAIKRCAFIDNRGDHWFNMKYYDTMEDCFIAGNYSKDSTNGISTFVFNVFYNYNNIFLNNGMKFRIDGGSVTDPWPVYKNNLFIGHQVDGQMIKGYIINNLFLGNRLLIPQSSTAESPFSGVSYNNMFINNKSIVTGKPWIPFGGKKDTLILHHDLLDLPCSEYQNPLDCQDAVVIAADPLFKDSAAMDFRLLACSPAINAGDNSIWANMPNPTDFDGNPRIQDGQVDIGPFESGVFAQQKLAEVFASCGLDPSGSVRFFLENGCPPFTFQWANGTQTGTDTTKLASGGYAFTIVDAKGRTTVVSLDVPGSMPVLQISGDTVVCEGNENAMLVAQQSGGVEPTHYVWSTGQEGPLLTNIDHGTYYLTATDAIGCRSLDTATIQVSPPILADFDIKNASGPSQSDGQIKVSLNGGLPPFNVLWSNGDTTTSIQHLLPGTYKITVTNAIGCQEVFETYVDFGIDTHEQDYQNKVNVFPNPANGQVIFSWGEFDSFELFDLLGQRLISKKRSNTDSRFSVKSLPSGDYIYTFYAKSGLKTIGKLVIAN